MSQFRVSLHGTGINLPSSKGSPSAIGFYVTCLIEGSDPVDASEHAKTLVLNEWQSGRFAQVNCGNLPDLVVESVARATFADRLRLRKSGYVFYPEESSDGVA